LRVRSSEQRRDKTGSDEQSDGPKRGIGRFLMENLLAPARSSGALSD
jgi:hypothetical protein